MPHFGVRHVSVVASLFLGCTFSHKEAAPGSNTVSGYDGSAGVDRNFVMGDVGTIVNGDSSCGSMAYTANHLPPDLLILLDRSGSMNEDSMGVMQMAGSANTKWAQMTAAINQVVGPTEGTVRWGLKFFGNMPTGCGVSMGAAVAPGTANSAAAIAAAMAAPANQPGSSTPTRAAETSAGVYLGGLMDPNPKYILLATDGQPNCAANGGGNAVDDPGAIAAVGSVAAMGFPTFVIGIATTGMANTTLNSMATSGGHPRAADPMYYPVSNTSDLAAALMAIQAMVNVPCNLVLPGMPSDPSMVSVIVGGQPLDKASWMFNAGNRSITITGATCAMLTSGALKDVSINIGCGTIIP